MSSTLAESYNYWILEDKNLPITAILGSIRVRVMNMFLTQRQKSLQWKTKLCSELEKKLATRMNEGKSWTVVNASNSVYEVKIVHHRKECWKC